MSSLPSLSTKSEYIYLLQQYAYVRLDEPTYKIGKTTQIGFRRLKGYPKESYLFGWFRCDDCSASERRLLCRFRKEFVQNNAGAESFDGDVDRMLQLIVEEVTTHYDTVVVNDAVDDESSADHVYASERLDTCDGKCCNAEVKVNPSHCDNGQFGKIWDNGCAIRKLGLYGRSKLAYYATSKGLPHSGIKKAELFAALAYHVVEADLPIKIPKAKRVR